VVDSDECWALHDGVWNFIREGGPWEAHRLCWECTDDRNGDCDTADSTEQDGPGNEVCRQQTGSCQEAQAKPDSKGGAGLQKIAGIAGEQALGKQG
jgi:hypothetical protein